jgi:tetratricopeptide (TPR) repeat protein
LEVARRIVFLVLVAVICTVPRAATATDPNVLAESDVLLGESLFVTMQDNDALDALQRVALISSTDETFVKSRPNWLAKAAYQKARVLLRQEHTAEAMQTCDDALRQFTAADNGTLRDLKILKANTLLHAGKLDDALAVVNTLRDGDSSEEWNAFVDELIPDFYLQAKRYGEALQRYLQFIRGTSIPEEMQAGSRYKIAFCYRSLGDIPHAREYLNELIVRYPKTSWVGSAQKALSTWAADRAAVSGPKGGAP